MPTQKKRINITIPADVALFLEHLALRDDMPQAAKALDLLTMGLMMEEDYYDAKIADDIMKRSKGATIAHDDFWSKVL